MILYLALLYLIGFLVCWIATWAAVRVVAEIDQDGADRSLAGWLCTGFSLLWPGVLAVVLLAALNIALRRVADAIIDALEGE